MQFGTETDSNQTGSSAFICAFWKLLLWRFEIKWNKIGRFVTVRHKIACRWGLKSSGMWRRVAGLLFPEFSKRCNDITRRIEGPRPLKNLSKRRQPLTASHTAPTSSSVKRWICSGRFDHKFTALFISSRKDFGKGLWRAKKWSVAATKTECNLYCIWRRGSYRAVNTLRLGY